MKYLVTFNESIRDKMTPKSKEDIRISIKNKLDINGDYIEVKIPEPKELKKIRSLLNLSDKYNLDIKDYKDNNILICGDIIGVFFFIEFYLNYTLINKTNSKTFFIKYILNNIVKNTLNESIRDKMIPKTKDEILSNLDYKNVIFKSTPKTSAPSWYIGNVITTYDNLIKLFGKPKYETGEEFSESHFEWDVESDDGKVLNIYDRHYDGSHEKLMEIEYKWHIGGRDNKDANDLIAYIYKNTI